MKNIKLRFVGLLMSTILVFSLFIFGIVYYFVPKSCSKKLESLTDYVTYLNKHKEYDNEFIGKFIINNKWDYYQKEFNKLEKIDTSSLNDSQTINNKYIHNSNDIDKTIKIKNNLLINHSLITNIQFSYPKANRSLTIRDSIVGINIENIQSKDAGHINLNISNSFIYLQGNNVKNNSAIFPLLSGYINNSLIGNRISYAKGQKPFYFTNAERGKLIRLTNRYLLISSSYYDIKKT